MSSLFRALLLFLVFPVALSAAPPHIVVILVDDMGYGDPGFNNAESKIPTPHLDRLASQGMRFTDAHAPGPLCHMSRYGLMTGRYPFRTDVSKWPRQPLIGEEQMTIADLAKGNGYRTAMVGKWHLGFRENGYDQPLPGGPVDCGFDRFFGIRASTDIPPYFYIEGDRAVTPPTETIAANASDGWSPIQGAFWRKGGIAPDLALKDVLPAFTDRAIRELETHSTTAGNDPLFLYLAYPAPHTPWLPSPAFAGKSAVGMYGDFVMMVDHEVGRVLRALEDTGMVDDTLLVFTSDNGPVWYDTDVERFGHDSSGGLRGMKGDAWEAGHRMPFAVRWPGRVGAGTTSKRTIGFTDFFATMADLLETALPAAAAPDSVSFLPTLRGEDQPPRPPLVMQSARKGTMVIRDGPWKLITKLGSGGFSKPSHQNPDPDGPRGQLCNLANDPGEETNLWLEHPELVERLEKELRSVVGNGRK